MKKPFQKNIPIKIVFILLICFSIFVNESHAQGPNAPEAASFEPVDATDMVNLVTGNLSYVLPLLNIPSPEGGYPISLSYHAGIAMEQEASWVGLGWNINPGSINRGVNGYPDDWGKTNISEFFYDEGWEEDYYNFSAGYTISDKISVGLGLSWGSNQSLGGYVSASIGVLPQYGDSTARIGGRIGTNGVSVTGSHISGFSGSIGTSGIGLGYGTRGSASLGVQLNYNYNYGLSGGASISAGNSSLGINMSSSGFSATGSISGAGVGISNSAGPIDSGDYDRVMSGAMFFIPYYSFFASFSHINVKYSLFKVNNLYTSGVLYPVKANALKLQENSSNFSKRMNENHFMDINSVQPFGKTDIYDDLVDNGGLNDRNNLTLPSYDNYSVNAQGLAGNITPYLDFELNLSGRGRGEQNNDKEYLQYLNHSFQEYENNSIPGFSGDLATSKKFFTFSSSYSSFLRVDKTNLPVVLDIQDHNVTDFTVLNTYNYSESNTFQNTNSIINRKKREGNHIITYTNKEIREGNLNGFIEAKEGIGFLARSDTDIFLDEGIGAYKITSMDGKTYHYSLPVYQYESTYKNFRNEDYNEEGEDENFFEIYKDTPYATHWLLTAVTGPDYYDKNENGKVDKEDYGYWVEFDYGKWSDGYIWQTPNGRYEETTDKDDATKKTYSYAWGRKQVYYLDAIKTRTHTALFVKELRNDNKGNSKNYSKQLSSSDRIVAKPGDNFFGVFTGTTSSDLDRVQAAFNVTNLVNNSWWVVPNQVPGPPNGMTPTNLNYYKGYKTKVVDYDLKENLSLKLSKIILLKNNENFNTLRNNGIHEGLQKTSSMEGYFLIGGTGSFSFRYFADAISFDVFNTKLYLKDPATHFKQFNIHQHQNVLDIKDIEGLNIESQALQVIDFDHDYSLANKVPNAETGRLTLKAVNFKGKYGKQVVPPYKFEYKSPWRDYNKDDIDAWGYHKVDPSVWSLNKITTPTGGKINIDYGKDKYISEAAYSEKVFSNFSSLTTSGRFYFTENSPIVSDYFVINEYYRIWGNDEIQIPGTDVPAFDASYKLTNFSSNWLEFDLRGDAPIPQTLEQVKIYGKINSLLSSPEEGGGIITNSITINDGIKDIATTEYIYRNGITSYAPSKEPKGIPYVSELPAPMVLYGEVAMNTTDGNRHPLGSTVYEFETLEPIKEEDGYLFSLGEVFRVKENQNTTFEGGRVITNKYTIESRLGNIGRIKTIKSYNTQSQLLQKTENFYKQNLDADGEIGVTQESHMSYKRYEKDDVETFYVSSTSKINYPSVLERITTSQGNFNVTKHFDKYDFLTGQVLETRTYASDGVAFKSKIIPAYEKYLEMGSKIDNENYSNMLTQQAMSKTYLKEDGNWKEISANITTWNNNWSYRNFSGAETSPTNNDEKIWRKHKNYYWDGNRDANGLYADFNTENDDGFNWGIGANQSPSSKWKWSSETTRYDHFSMALEHRDLNDNYAATKMGDNNSKVLAVSNAAYVDMYYSGAEYLVTDVHGDPTGYFDGEIQFTGYNPSSTAHTGTHIVAISAGQNAFEVAVPARTGRNTPKKQRFKVSVWIRTPQKDKARIKVGDATVNFTANETQTAGAWTLLNGYINIPAAGTTVAIISTNGSIQLDDFRLHPITASMTSYVYNEFDEVSYIIGASGLATHYKYDNAGRLSETWTEIIDNPAANITGGFKKVQQHNYNFKNQ